MAEGKEVNISTVTDLELARLLNEYHAKLREAEKGLMQIGAEVGKRQQEALKLSTEKEGE